MLSATGDINTCVKIFWIMNLSRRKFNIFVMNVNVLSSCLDTSCYIAISDGKSIHFELHVGHPTHCQLISN